MINKKFIPSYLKMVISYSKEVLTSGIAVIADLVPTKRDRLSEKNLIFIAGVEGSGTTLLNRLLSESKDAMSITHHSYLKAEPVSLPDEVPQIPKVSLIQNFQNLATVKKFNRLVNKLWQFPYSNNQNMRSQILTRLRDLKITASISNIVIKRSYPSRRQGIIFPNLADLFWISKKVKIIYLKRNLKKNASSVLRRGFVNAVEEAIERVMHADRILKSQLDMLESSEVLAITYEDLVHNKYQTLGRVENFLGYEPGELKQLSSWTGRGSAESRRILEENRAQFEKGL